MRSVIVKSSSTSTGGNVLQGTDILINDGYPVALIGMQASCPVCKKGIGDIVAKGPHQQFVNGTAIALEGDIVACGCPEGSNVVLPLTRLTQVK
ncbi:PAAR domain-containing protein [Superficieibacter sp.]|uniref:PAAR domain-containing protein n=1 Tax=Superficieibacter sp. TaxID=2303322 RepID=UPI0028A6D121|nr:PAAR domain-containing protein [Superficieibacter sp.]